MVKSKKLLSLFLAVVMVLSVFTVMASAYTRGATEGTSDIDVKYTVEKVASLPDTDAGSVALNGDNFYAVTVWMKSAKPIDTFTVPFHYNKAHFSPITLSDGEFTYPYGAGLDQDTYYTDMGEGAIYAYSLGDYMNNTGMYTATGATAKTKALAKCIGLGNENSTGVGVITELVSPDHTLYSKWGAGLSADTGVLYVNLDVACNAKTAYLNTLEGIATYTDWVNMFTLYFESITDEDVTGDEFGVFTDDCFTVDGCYDANGKGYYESAAAYDAQVPTMNIVSNAVVEAAATPLTVSYWKDQIRFDTKADGSYYGTFDYRILATIDNFDEVIGTNYDMVTEVGFLFQRGEGANVDATTAQAELQAGNVTSYSQVKKVSVSTSYDGASYVMACTVNNIPDADKGTELSAMAYVVYVQNGETKYAFSAVQTSTFEGLYNTYYSQAFPA